MDLLGGRLALLFVIGHWKILWMIGRVSMSNHDRGLPAVSWSFLGGDRRVPAKESRETGGR
jgi:hypothetical protein